MKSKILLTLLISLHFTCFSQIVFEPGYYISNDGHRVEGLIKNMDWETSPDNFLFQETTGGAARQFRISDAKEFGIINASRYVRATVDVDYSSNNLESLSSSPQPEYKKETVFLRLLVSGKASLYRHAGSGREWYFLQYDTTSMVPLVYKLYKLPGGYGTNAGFRSQLIGLFACESPGRKDIDRASYTQRDLTKLFLQYNACMSGEAVNLAAHERAQFNLWIRPRLTQASFAAQHYNGYNTTAFDFEKQLNFSLGVEAEIILPFNKNKWAVIVEPGFERYDATISSEPIKVEYTALQLPIGVRHYFFLSDKSKISVSAQYQLNFAGSSKVTRFSKVELELGNSANLVFEAGYVLSNRFCLAYRYQTGRELLGSYQNWQGDYKTMSVVLGFSPF